MARPRLVEIPHNPCAPVNKWPYFHVVLRPDIVKEIKLRAKAKGYRIGPYTGMLLEFALKRTR